MSTRRADANPKWLEEEGEDLVVPRRARGPKPLNIIALMTQREAAIVLGISMQAVQAAEKRALEKIRAGLLVRGYSAEAFEDDVEAPRSYKAPNARDMHARTW